MKIGIIGFGHLGKALVRGLLHSGFVSVDDIFICAKSKNTLNIAKIEYGIKAYEDVNIVIANTDIIFLVIKGTAFDEISTGINNALLEGKQIVSFMAGVPIQKIKKKLCKALYITRAMPSIAIEKCNGIIGYTVVKDERISKIFNNLGYAFIVDEKDIEKVTGFSACGLGFAAYILDAFQNAGINLGFDKDISKKIVAKTFENSIEMSNYKMTVSEVATEGGATEQGILHFEAKDIKGIIDEAIQKAYKKMI